MRRYFPPSSTRLPHLLRVTTPRYPAGLAAGNGAAILEIAQQMKYELHGGSMAEDRLRALSSFLGMQGDFVAGGDPKQSEPHITSIGVVDDYIAHRYVDDSGQGDFAVDVPGVWMG